MSESGKVRHDQMVRTIAERYRREGYQVNEEPPEGALPFELGGYRPDLIAQKGNRAIIVEVRASPERTSFERLRSVVDEVKRHEGWEFILVTPNDLVSDMDAGDDDQLSWEEIDLRIKRAQRISGQGEDEAAYLLMWIAFEQALRLRARRISLPVDRLAPAILIRQLYSEGELSMSQFDTALVCQSARNHIVHGLPTRDLQTLVRRLEALVREVVEQWRNPACES